MVFAFVAGCSPLPLEPSLVPVLEPEFPDRATLDYVPRPVFAHAAMPLFDPSARVYASSGRVWVKGGPQYPKARIGDAVAQLAPPFYTAVLEAPPGDAVVAFSGDASVPEVEVGVTVVDPIQLSARSESFSMLGFGCFDPFHLVDGMVLPNPGKKDAEAWPRLTAIRALFEEAAKGALAGLSAPSVVLGAGDQVYVEPAHDQYAEYGADHPLSAWTVEAHPAPRLGVSAFRDFLDATYRSSWSFEPLDRVFRSCPSVMVWDDHEIRDGWGSQGDEHLYRDTYYAEARRAYVQHQVLRGPRRLGDDAQELTAPLDQQFEIHQLPVFVLDERSARDCRVPQVLGRDQSEAFRRWLERLDPERSRHYVIVSPLPLLYRVTDMAALGASFGPEVTDDLLDHWDSDINRAEYHALLGAILAASKRGLRCIILSGDMHNSALMSASVTSGGMESVFAYEIIASGLAMPIDDSGWKFALGRAGALIADPVRIGGETVRMDLGVSDPSPNFCALQFDGDQATAHLLQATAEGPVHYRVPLAFGTDAPSVGSLAKAGRHLLDAPEQQ